MPPEMDRQAKSVHLRESECQVSVLQKQSLIQLFPLFFSSSFILFSFSKSSGCSLQEAQKTTDKKKNTENHRNPSKADR